MVSATDKGIDLIISVTERLIEIAIVLKKGKITSKF